MVAGTLRGAQDGSSEGAPVGTPNTPPKLVASTKDPLGRTVVLTEYTWWSHILDPKGHPELEGLEMAVMRVVEDADHTCDGNFPGAKAFYKRNLGPARYLAVVVAYDGQIGRVITAYPCSKEPKTQR